MVHRWEDVPSFLSVWCPCYSIVGLVIYEFFVHMGRHGGESIVKIFIEMLIGGQLWV